MYGKEGDQADRHAEYVVGNAEGIAEDRPPDQRCQAAEQDGGHTRVGRGSAFLNLPPQQPGEQRYDDSGAPDGVDVDHQAEHVGQHQCEQGGSDAEQDRHSLGDDQQLPLRSLRIDEFVIDVTGEGHRPGVEEGVARRHDRREQCRHDQPADPGGKDGLYKRGHGEIRGGGRLYAHRHDADGRGGREKENIIHAE